MNKLWHWVCECTAGHAIAKSKTKQRAGEIAFAENLIRLKMYKGKLKNGETPGCKCGSEIQGIGSRRITDKTWSKLK